MADPVNGLLAARMDPERRRRIGNALLAYQYDRETPQDAAVTERAGLFPLGTYANGQTGIAWPGIVATPVEKMAQVLRGEITPGTPEFNEAGFDIAGAAMVGGLAAARPRGSLGMSGRPTIAEEVTRGTAAPSDRLPVGSSAPNPPPSLPMGAGQPVPVLSRPPHLQGPAPHTTIADDLSTSAFHDPPELAGMPASMPEDAAVNFFVNGFRAIEAAPLDKWPQVYGLRRMNASDDVKPNDYLRDSRVWDDGTPTSELLDGTSAIRLGEFPPSEASIRQALKTLRSYEGDRIVPIGGKRSTSSPQDRDEVVVRNAYALFANARPGAALGAGLSGASERQGIRAYHGSPHDFDRFDMSKIGTGEGAQAYGHGLYFAEREGVARSYRDSLGGQRFKDGSAFDDSNPAHQASAYIAGTKSKDEALAAIEQDIAMSRRQMDEKHAQILLRAKGMMQRGEPIPEINPGRMYEVNIKANPDDFLDWDKPISQQSEKVRGVLNALGAAQATPGGVVPRANVFATGVARDGSAGAAVQALRDQYGRETPLGNFVPRVEDKLREAGIPGIKYLDQGSRSAGDGSRNYVVFDANLIEILRKYGLLGMLGAGGMAQELMKPSTPNIPDDAA
jgi:hypothetical protein